MDSFIWNSFLLNSVVCLSLHWGVVYFCPSKPLRGTSNFALSKTCWISVRYLDKYWYLPPSTDKLSSSWDLGLYIQEGRSDSWKWWVTYCLGVFGMCYHHPVSISTCINPGIPPHIFHTWNGYIACSKLTSYKDGVRISLVSFSF